jgi:outer membrane protein
MKWKWFIIGLAGAGAVLAQQPRRLTLAEAHDLAIKNHPQISAARFSAQAAEQAVTETRSAYFPNFFASLTGAGAANDSRIAAGGLGNSIIFNRFATGFSVSQTLLDFGRTANLTESSRLHARAQDRAVETSREQVLLDVDHSFYAALRAQSVLRVAEETVKERQLIVDQVTALAANKLKSGLDVSFANVNLSEAKLLLLSAQNDLSAAFTALSTALGYRDQQSLDLVDEPLPPAPPADFRPLVDQATRQRPELAGLEFERDAAQRFATAEKDLYFPTIGAVASAGLIPGHDDHLRGRYSAAGLNISIPVFNGRLFSARHAEAELRAQSLDQSTRDLANRIARDVRLAALNAQTAYQRITVTAQLLDQADRALDLAQSRYDLGLGSIVELSQAQLNKTSAEIANASARYDYQIQHSVLDFAVGNLR